MGSLSEHQRCARGERCVGYDPGKGSSAKLASDNKTGVCAPCERKEGDADFETLQRVPSIEHRPVVYKENSLGGRLECLKRNLVAQMLAQRGTYWEAIREVRARWQLDSVPIRLPPESNDILYPQSVPTQQPPRPKEYILPPDIPNPDIGEPGDLKQYEDWFELRRSWELDLSNMLRCGVPERYLGEECPPYRSWPPPAGRSSPWYRFAAACALYHPPVEEAPQFAEYGGMPLVSGGEKTDGPVLDVLSEQELREGAIDLAVQQKINNKISEKMWERRSELGELNYREARREVLSRHKAEFEAEFERLWWERYEREIGLDSPHLLYIPFDPIENTYEDVKKVLKVIRASMKDPSGGGRKSNDDLLPVMCALLLQKPGWSSERLAPQLGLSKKRVDELAEQGRPLLSPNR